MVLVAWRPVMAQSEGGAAPEGVEAAKSFLALIDAVKYDESWDAAAPTLKGLVKQGMWTQIQAANHRRFGTLSSRRFESAEATTTIPGSPDGQYVVVKYRSTYGSKRASETVTVTHTDEGQWKVLQYELKKAK
jgi:hypothetical protein